MNQIFYYQYDSYFIILLINEISLGGQVPAGSALSDDYIYCNMCTRKYNENAYSKHLPTCERRTKEAQFKKGGGNSNAQFSQNTGNRSNFGNVNNTNKMGGNNMMMNNNNMNPRYGRK